MAFSLDQAGSWYGLLASNGAAWPHPTPGRHPEVHCWTWSANRGPRAKGRIQKAQEKEERLETETKTWRAAGGEAKNRGWGQGWRKRGSWERGARLGTQPLGKQELEEESRNHLKQAARWRPAPLPHGAPPGGSGAPPSNHGPHSAAALLKVWEDYSRFLLLKSFPNKPLTDLAGP